MFENGTTIKLIIGETVIPATLNDSKPAQALLDKLPYTLSGCNGMSTIIAAS